MSLKFSNNLIYSYIIIQVVLLMRKCYAIRIWKNIIEMVDLYLIKFLFIYELTMNKYA